jgi:predicted outer membrane repeat protein
MRHRIVFSSLTLLGLFLTLAPAALASSKWYVDGVNGSDSNNCKSRQHACKTIGHAISLASSGDTIMVAAATYTENLNIHVSLKIIGSSAGTTIINGGQINTVIRIFSGSVTLSKVRISGGRYLNGGGITNAGTLAINNSIITGNAAHYTFGATGLGGGILNSGTLTINHSTLNGNSADHDGGSIFNSGMLTISNSTLSGNTADVGAGIGNHLGRVTISNSTLSLNRADHDGGGIYTDDTLRISNSTLSGNSAVDGNGGGIYNYNGMATLQNSIVTDSPGGNCNGAMTSNGYNLSSDDTCNFDKSGDLNNTDPKLGQLGFHGGPTQTIPLLDGSPAIDAGNPNGCTDGVGHLLKTDQRGKPRPDHGDTSGCDMGAYERQQD